MFSAGMPFKNRVTRAWMFSTEVLNALRWAFSSRGKPEKVTGSHVGTGKGAGGPPSPCSETGSRRQWGPCSCGCIAVVEFHRAFDIALGADDTSARDSHRLFAFLHISGHHTACTTNVDTFSVSAIRRRTVNRRSERKTSRYSSHVVIGPGSLLGVRNWARRRPPPGPPWTPSSGLCSWQAIVLEGTLKPPVGFHGVLPKSPVKIWWRIVVRANPPSRRVTIFKNTLLAKLRPNAPATRTQLSPDAFESAYLHYSSEPDGARYEDGRVIVRSASLSQSASLL